VQDVRIVQPRGTSVVPEYAAAVTAGQREAISRAIDLAAREPDLRLAA
jgi:hypothetical protein